MEDIWTKLHPKVSGYVWIKHRNNLKFNVVVNFLMIHKLNGLKPMFVLIWNRHETWMFPCKWTESEEFRSIQSRHNAMSHLTNGSVLLCLYNLSVFYLFVCGLFVCLWYVRMSYVFPPEKKASPRVDWKPHWKRLLASHAWKPKIILDGTARVARLCN